MVFFNFLPLIDMLHSAAIPAEDKSRAIVVTGMLVVFFLLANTLVEVR